MRRPQSRDNAVRRQRLLSAVSLLIGAALLLRVAYLQTVRRDHFAHLADRIRGQTVVVTPRRGEIVDRNGLAIARTRDVYRIEFDRYAFAKAWSRHGIGGATDRAAALLGAMLGMERAAVKARMQGPLARGETERRCVIKDSVTVEEAQAVEYVLKHKPNPKSSEPHILQGTVMHSGSERTYIGGDTSAAVIGRVTNGPLGTLRGIGGLEDWADAALGGSVGWYRQRVDSARRPNPLMPARRAQAVQGLDVRLTLDLNIQRICAAELDQCMAEHTPVGATAIVLDPATGDVLGMVSRPSLDLSMPDLGRALVAAPECLTNRALLAYEPGSVMKPITVSIALDDGTVSTTQVIDCGGSFVPGKRSIRCEAHKSSTPPAGTNTPRMIIAKSCNVATAKIALALGAARLHAGLKRFGLLDPTGVQMPGDAAGWSPTGSAKRPGRDDIARIGFGQSVTVTPLGLAAAFGAIANDGVLMRPRLISSFSLPNGDPVREFRVDRIGQAISPTTAAEMRSYLMSVVQLGTGKNARVSGYTTAGKTGTAQKVKHGAYQGYIASFIGFVPATAPRAVIAVVVDEPQNGYHGSQAAAPAWARIADRLMQYWHVPPDDPDGAFAGKRRPSEDRRATGD